MILRSYDSSLINIYVKVYSITPVLDKEKRGLALDGKLKHEDTNLASSTLVKDPAAKENLGIIVSYKVRSSLLGISRLVSRTTIMRICPSVHVSVGLSRLSALFVLLFILFKLLCCPPLPTNPLSIAITCRLNPCLYIYPFETLSGESAIDHFYGSRRFRGDSIHFDASQTGRASFVVERLPIHVGAGLCDGD